MGNLPKVIDTSPTSVRLAHPSAPTDSTTDASRRPATRSLKERQREERAALILEAAYDVLVEKGYHEASIDEIAARVGISKGTVYLH